MKRVVFIIFFIAMQAHADPLQSENIQLAKAVFFDSKGMNIDDHIDSMTQMILTRKPEWEKYRELIRVKVEGIFSSESYQNKVAKIISKNFTHNDLVELSDIMNQPVMIKWNKRMPQFWPEIAMTTTDHVLPIIGDLVYEIAEKERTISDSKEFTGEENQCLKLIRNNKCKELHVYADIFLKNNPNDIEALYSKGYCYHKEKSYNQAERFFLAVYGQNTDYRRVNYNLAQLYLDVGTHELALKYAVNETKLHPEDPDSFILLALVYLKNNDNVKACETFRNAEIIEPRVVNFPEKLEACGL